MALELNLHLSGITYFYTVQSCLSEKNRENTPLHAPHPIVAAGFTVAAGAEHSRPKLADIQGYRQTSKRTAY